MSGDDDSPSPVGKHSTDEESTPKKHSKKSKKEKKHHKKKDKSSFSDDKRLTEKSHINPEHKPLLREILNKIEDLPIAIQFRDPFPWRRKLLF